MFTTTLSVGQDAEKVFEAIIQPRAWWSPSITGRAECQGDEFVFDSPGHHVWKFRVLESVRPRRIVWQVTDDSWTGFVDDKSEWNGTTVRFDLESQGGLTRLRFSHGLDRQMECFESCSLGWTGYIQSSLPKLLATGSGEPGRY